MIATLSVLSMSGFFSLRFNSATPIEEVALGMIAKAGESLFVFGILILVLFVGILLLVFAHRVQKWAVKCHKEQERLNVLFEDQMFLLGRYYEDLVGIKGTLSELKEILHRPMSSEPPGGSTSSAVGARAEVSAVSDALLGEDSMTTPDRKENVEDGKHRQQISEGKRLVEEKLRKLAQETGIEVKELTWYEKSHVVKSEYPYVLMVSAGDKPEECEFSNEELTDFLTLERIDTVHKISAIINGLKRNTR